MDAIKMQYMCSTPFFFAWKCILYWWHIYVTPFRYLLFEFDCLHADSVRWKSPHFSFFLFVIEQTEPKRFAIPNLIIMEYLFVLWCWTINIDRHRHSRTVYASFHSYERLSWHRANINVMKYPFNSSFFFFHFFWMI